MSEITPISTIHFYLQNVTMLRAIGFVILLPAVVMSISFLMEGKMPLMWGPVLFTIGFILLGYRGHIFFDTQDTKITIEKRTWGIPFYKKHFDRKEIDYFAAYQTTYESKRWEKNEHTNQYESHKTGETGSYITFLMHLDQKNYTLVPPKNMEVSEFRSISRRLSIRFYGPNQTLPPRPAKTPIPWAKYIFITIIILTIANISRQEWEKYSVFEESKKAAQKLGIHIEPNMPPTKLPKDTWILIYVKESKKWEAGKIIIDSYPKKTAFVKYMLNGEANQSSLPRNIMRKYEEF